MITLQQVQKYKRCRINNVVDIEAYMRWSSQKDKDVLSIQQIERIHLIRYGLCLIKNNSEYLSEDFIKAFNSLISKEFQNKKALNSLKRIDQESLWKLLFVKR